MRRALKHGPWVAVAAVLAIVVAGNALAFWTGTGYGNAETSVDKPLPLTMQAGTPSAQLYPGGDASVSAVISNPNPYAVRVGSLSLDTSQGTGGFDVDTEHSGCAVSSLSFTAQDNEGEGWNVPPKAGGTDGTLLLNMAGALKMGLDAGDACQGAVFTIHLAVSD